MFCAGKTAILDDYRKLELYDASTQKERARFSQDKGHAFAWNYFVDTILDGGSPPISYQEIIHTAYTTLACDQTLRTGQPVEMREFIQTK